MHYVYAAVPLSGYSSIPNLNWKSILLSRISASYVSRVDFLWDLWGLPSVMLFLISFGFGLWLLRVVLGLSMSTPPSALTLPPEMIL